nr:PREDICTED: sperm surface protein Sp17-like [Bemisia tabaci]
MGCNTSKEVIQSVINEKTKGSPGAEPDPEHGVGAAQPDNEPQEINLFEEFDPEDQNTVEAATKIQAVFRGHKTRKQMMTNTDEEKANFELEFSPDDKELTDAATKIQASFRGHMARKQVQDDKPEGDGGKEAEELSSQLEKLDANKELDQELLDIDLTDPDLHKAATKIQASFRGHKVRKAEEEGESN